MIKLIKRNFLFFLGVGFLLYLLVKYLFDIIFSSDGIKPKSKDKTVDSAIHILDGSFDKYGKFDKDHIPVFNVLKKMSNSQLAKLHNDFGYRYYSYVTGAYGTLPFLGGYSLARRKDLNALYLTEFSPSQLIKLKKIYSDKNSESLLLGN